MQRHFGWAALIFLLSAGIAVGQTPMPLPPPGSPNAQSAPMADELTPQVLGEMLQSANTFHELVRNLNLSESLGPDQHVEGPDGRMHHPIKRTAQAMGAGAGAGAAVGAMTKSKNGILIGALVGSAGGLIIDQILKHRERSRERALEELTLAPVDTPAPANTPF